MKTGLANLWRQRVIWKSLCTECRLPSRLHRKGLSRDHRQKGDGEGERTSSNARYRGQRGRS